MRVEKIDFTYSKPNRPPVYLLREYEWEDLAALTCFEIYLGRPNLLPTIGLIEDILDGTVKIGYEDEVATNCMDYAQIFIMIEQDFTYIYPNDPYGPHERDYFDKESYAGKVLTEDLLAACKEVVQHTRGIN